MLPQLGLVCVTACEKVRYRTITRTRFLALSAAHQESTLVELYEANLYRLEKAVRFCERSGIRLYRISSDVFPMADEPLGIAVLQGLARDLSLIGRRAESIGLRMTIHPDQFVVLSSDSPQVVATSVRILEKHGRTMDLLGLPRSPWAAMTVHGGKAGRADRLVETIKMLPDAVRSRLTLENDEYSYSAVEILDICRRAKVPMIFDCHHHAVHEQLTDYDDPSVARFVAAARETWEPHPEWQLCHLSNGKEAFDDPRHSEFITRVPKAYADVPWVDVEARGKEEAIARLKAEWASIDKSPKKRAGRRSARPARGAKINSRS